jgi:uncharacterized FAD-dependent dehydrogenase
MKSQVDIKLPPGDHINDEIIRRHIANLLHWNPEDITHIRLLKRSLDARGKRPQYLLRFEVFAKEEPSPEPALLDEFKPVHQGKKVIIVGAGPAGYFAALELIRLGLKPVVLDRGKDVRSRRRDLKAIQQLGIVDPHSNYCFGEGGAGTYSDGKLYTRSSKRGDIDTVLKLFVEHGADSNILVEAHPHIGTNKLPGIVGNMRETIIHYGGEVIFDAYVNDFILENNEMKGVIVNDSIEYRADAVILATGHSARDIYYLLQSKGILIEIKPFALGVRVEHPQSIIDEIQYGRSDRGEFLPPASYSLTCQVMDRGVFSFCMCPGGMIVPAATAPGEIVVNGMSPSRRDSPYSNSGVVVSVENEDLMEFQAEGVFATLAFQKSVEQAVFAAGDGSQKAPALRLTDFVNKKMSSGLSDSSYVPGLFAAPLYDILPPFIYRRLKEGLVVFGKKMRGYMTDEANVIATESRTSAPIRIPRDKETCMHPEVKRLYPCGEGAGYAGGIVSAALDGIKVARQIALHFN